MPNKIAFVYPGQGAQKVGMGQDFYDTYESARELFDAAQQILDFDLRSTCFVENEKIHQTSYTQPAIVATSLAITRCLEKNGIIADLTAGLSLGEYSAIAAAKGISELDAIRLVSKRGCFMEEAVPNGQGAMAAVFGMEKDEIAQVVSAMDGVWIANYNCPGQIVITGNDWAIKETSELLKNKGAKRVIPLNVSGPFHSPIMMEAAGRLEKELLSTLINPLQIPYVANVNAKTVYEKEMIIPLLKRQMTHPVLWEQTIRTMLAKGIDTFLEVGPGHTLTNLIKKIDSNVAVYPVGTVEEMERVMGELLCRANK